MVGLVGRLPLLAVRSRLAPPRPGDGPVGLLALRALAEQLAALEMQQPLGTARVALGVAAVRARSVRLPGFHHRHHLFLRILSHEEDRLSGGRVHHDFPARPEIPAPSGNRNPHGPFPGRRSRTRIDATRQPDPPFKLAASQPLVAIGPFQAASYTVINDLLKAFA